MRLQRLAGRLHRLKCAEIGGGGALCRAFSILVVLRLLRYSPFFLSRGVPPWLLSVQATLFVRACEGIPSLLAARGLLTVEDREVIEFSAIDRSAH